MRILLISIFCLGLSACSDDNSNSGAAAVAGNWRRSDNIKVNTFAMKTVDACNGFALENNDTVIIDMLRIEADGSTYNLKFAKAGQIEQEFIGTVANGALTTTNEYRDSFLPFNVNAVNVYGGLKYGFSLLVNQGQNMKVVATSQYLDNGSVKTFNTTEQNFNYLNDRDAEILKANAVACSLIKAP